MQFSIGKVKICPKFECYSTFFLSNTKSSMQKQANRSIVLDIKKVGVVYIEEEK